MDWDMAMTRKIAHGRFPAATRLMVQRLRATPPRWPVSGLAETTRDAFPECSA
jgi:hypothetical protein